MFLNSKDNVEFKSRNLSSFEFEGNTYRSLFKFSQEQEASKLRVGGELVVGIEGDFNVFGGEVLVTDGTIGQIKGDFNIFSNQRGFANGEQKKTEKSYFLSKAESYFEKVESGFFQDRSVV
ncbi:MAG: hypothetical protein VW397_08070, partial [Candidatus Margulisiibacteriota bacterium]